MFGSRNLVVLQVGWDLIPNHLVLNQDVSTIYISKTSFINPHICLLYLAFDIILRGSEAHLEHFFSELRHY